METYKNLCTEYYDLDKPFAPDDALNFYLHYAKEAQGPILEPMCGTGRFLIPMLERGFAVEGLDASVHMLTACMKKCAERKLQPALYPQYLHEMSLDKKYALIFIPSASFGLFTDIAQIKSSLKLLYDHLLPNGKLVFEIETIHAIPKQLGIWEGDFCEKNDGSKILLSTLPFYQQTSQILQIICRYELIQNNQVIQTEIEDFHTRLYQHDEMDELLKLTGFNDVMRFKAYGLAEPDENDEVIIYECVKNSSSL